MEEAPLHLHTWKRTKRHPNQSEPIYMCTGPTCYKKARRSEIDGKLAQCGFCGKHFIAHGYVLRLAKPHCGCQRALKVAPDLDGKLSEMLERARELALDEEPE